MKKNKRLISVLSAKKKMIESLKNLKIPQSILILEIQKIEY